MQKCIISDAVDESVTTSNIPENLNNDQVQTLVKMLIIDNNPVSGIDSTVLSATNEDPHHDHTVFIQHSHNSTMPYTNYDKNMMTEMMMMVTMMTSVVAALAMLFPKRSRQSLHLLKDLLIVFHSFWMILIPPISNSILLLKNF